MCIRDRLLINQVQFQRDVPADPFYTVKLKSSLASLTLSAKTAFYDQAATLVFFLMNRAGPEGRAALLGALEAHYKGETVKDGWTSLGFATLEELDGALKAFLKSPSSGR